MKLTPLERNVLDVLDSKTVPEEFFVNFREIERSLELSRSTVRRACRALGVTDDEGAIIL
mgnify:CR=1 FL=1